MTRTYGHSEHRPAPLQEQIEIVLPVERAGNEGSGTSQSPSPGGELSDHEGPELSTEEAAETIDAAEVLRAEKEKYEAAEKTAWPEDLKGA